MTASLTATGVGGVDMFTMWVHNVTNTGDDLLFTLSWTTICSIQHLPTPTRRGV